MDMYGNTVSDRVKTFDSLHGDSVYDGAWIWYEDGARRDGNPLGPLVEPPKDPRSLHANIARYYQILLDQVVEDFDKLKQQLQQNPGLDTTGDADLKRLRKLRANAHVYRTKLMEHQKFLRQNSPGYLTPEEEEIHREQDAATAQAKQKFSEAVQAITI